MADNKAIITSTTPAGATVQKTITGISPYATNELIASLGSALNDFTDNTYGKTEKVTKVNCDAEEDDKQNPVLKLIDALGQDASTVRENTTFELAYTGNSTVYFTMLPATSTGTIELNATTEGGGIYKRVFRFTKGTSTKFALFSPETTAYNEAYIEYDFS